MDSLSEVKQKNILAVGGQSTAMKNQSTQTSNIAFVQMSPCETKTHKKSRVQRFVRRMDNFFQGSKKTRS